ncbi:unnamed protein product [Schistosoma curassoni]|uniref:Uncharacterized protein n=1 Tax=Schistosoma curassoni TaxID=6186 RepID=A0A183L1X2_9TREM|nr:unnamed protein product [Schistosoma curassoni]
MQMKTTSVAAVSASVGLNIHKGKRKMLEYNTENTNSITLGGETLEEVESFTYLGSITDERGGSDWQNKDSIPIVEEHMELKTTISQPISKSGS